MKIEVEHRIVGVDNLEALLRNGGLTVGMVAPPFWS